MIPRATSSNSSLAPRDPSPPELGRRIKMLRVSRGLTLKDLEERGGISATHVSEIERGKASPTVGALGRIARALGLRPATLVEAKIQPDFSVMRAEARANRSVQWAKARFEPLTEPIHCAPLGAHIMRLPVEREAALSHTHEGEEWATVLTGVVEITVDGTAHVLREGDCLHFRAHRPHSYSNLSSDPAVLMVAGRPQLAI